MLLCSPMKFQCHCASSNSSSCDTSSTPLGTFHGNLENATPTNELAPQSLNASQTFQYDHFHMFQRGPFLYFIFKSSWFTWETHESFANALLVGGFSVGLSLNLLHHKSRNVRWNRERGIRQTFLLKYPEFFQRQAHKLCISCSSKAFVIVACKWRAWLDRSSSAPFFFFFFMRSKTFSKSCPEIQPLLLFIIVNGRFVLQ